MPTKPLVIAIDGPAGSGKSTVAKELARSLGYIYIDTGAMYRCVTLAGMRQGVNFDDPMALEKLARSLRIELKPDPKGLLVFLDGEEVENLIRTPEISWHTSRKTANAPGVRQAMVARQRQMAEQGGLVMEGRDIGTVVFPNADLKVFFDVSVAERARRRILDYTQRGIPFVAEEVEHDIQRRDDEDRQRPISPLLQAQDAHLVLGDGKSVAQILDEIKALFPKAQ